MRVEKIFQKTPANVYSNLNETLTHALQLCRLYCHGESVQRFEEGLASQGRGHQCDPASIKSYHAEDLGQTGKTCLHRSASQPTVSVTLGIRICISLLRSWWLPPLSPHMSCDQLSPLSCVLLVMPLYD